MSPWMRGRDWRSQTRALVVAIATISLALAGMIVPGFGLGLDCDGTCERVRGELRSFTDWLDEHDALGYIGEVGWPDTDPGWNEIADRWYADADAAALPVTAWATGSWWKDYKLAAYENTDDTDGVDEANLQAAVIERHPTTDRYRRGVNVAGAEFGAPAVDPTSNLTNVYDRDYHYEPASTFTYLASRRIKIVRIPFRWERIQPRLGQPLDPAELGRLRTTVDAAGDAGLQVVLDLHNYAGYYIDGTRHALGSRTVRTEHLSDVWRRLSKHFRGHRAVYAYGVMNEPVGIAASSGLSAAQRWEIMSRSAVRAIRDNNDRKTIMVAGYEWSGVQSFADQHPRPWIPRSQGKIRYEAHHYFDEDHSGTYRAD